MKSYKIPAIVIGGGINSLGVIRNLGKNGVDVYCIAEKKAEAIYSCYCKKYFIYPNVEHEIKKLSTILHQIKNEIGDDYVLFPTSDISTLNVSILYEKIKNQHQFLPDRNTIKMLIEKKKFYYSLLKHNIPFPKTIFLNKLEDDLRIIKKSLFPLVLKPSQSQYFLEQFSKKGFIINSQEDLIKYLKISKKHNIEVFIQEIIPGPATNHYFIDGYFDKNSKPLILFARQRLRMWPSLLGNSTVCKSIPISEIPEMRNTIVRYLNNIRYKGIFNAEFKKDERDNVAKLLEINTRSWWYNSFPSSCGVNIIFTAYLDAILEKQEILKSYQTDKKMIYFTEDFKSILVNIFNLDFYLKNWLSILNGNVDWVLFDKQDLKPFFMKILMLISYISSHPGMFINLFLKNKQRLPNQHS